VLPHAMMVVSAASYRRGTWRALGIQRHDRGS
jgi:hypothetical protein